MAEWLKITQFWKIKINNLMPNVVITGASRGIGRAIAEVFVKNGAHVCICSRSETDLMQVQEQLKNLNPDVLVYFKAADFSKKSEVLAFGNFAQHCFNKVDVLVNNAGLFLGGHMHDEPDGQIEYLMQVNFLSAYYLTRSLLPSMIACRNGHIFNICSVASFMAYPNGGAYSASKFALLGFSKSLREEMKPYNIKVSAIIPGATYTQSWSETDLPQSRFMSPEDIAHMLYQIYLLSERTVVEEIVLRPMLGDI
jgi:short-subunit dehydrogenase